MVATHKVALAQPCLREERQAAQTAAAVARHRSLGQAEQEVMEARRRPLGLLVVLMVQAVEGVVDGLHLLGTARRVPQEPVDLSESFGGSKKP